MKTKNNRRRSGKLAQVLAGAFVIANECAAQVTTINGSSLAVRSTGTLTGGGVVQLRNNGYVGTYVTLTEPRTVTLSVNASGVAAGGVQPRMNVVVNDTKVGWDVGATSQSYTTTVSLPAGTHFIRTEFANDVLAVDRRLNVSSLTVSGGAVSNSHNNANALAAADTYVANYRQGNARVKLENAQPGTQVNVKLKRHDFRFGSIVPGTSTNGVNTYIGANPAAGSLADTFQRRFLENFNSVTPENIGKWASNEATRDVVTMNGLDRVLTFAEQNDLRVRMHNLIWGSQQPNFVNTLLTNAQAGDVAAATDLRGEISERIDYLVNDRYTRFDQLDVYNESIHTNQYFNVYGVQGVADIYNETAAASNGQVKLFTNEYNVLSDSSDAYANWYRSHVESIREAGGAVGGIGIQYYAYNQLGSGNSLHNASRLHGALQNLSVTGLALELTEFGIKDNGIGTFAEDQVTAADVLKESMRLVFGTPAMTGFTLWGFWGGSVWSGAPMGVLYNADWSLTPAGVAYKQLMEETWTTDKTLTVRPDGTVDFTGFYGDYTVEQGNVVLEFDLQKG